MFSISELQRILWKSKQSITMFRIIQLQLSGPNTGTVEFLTTETPTPETTVTMSMMITEWVL